MSADTLTPDGRPATLAAPTSNGLVSPNGPFTPTGFAVMSGASDEIAVSWIDSGFNVHLTGYSLDGTAVFQTVMTEPVMYLMYGTPQVASDPGEGVVVTWLDNGYGGHFHPNDFSHGFAVVEPDGTVAKIAYTIGGTTGSGQAAHAYSTVDGFALQWANTGITEQQAQFFYGDPSLAEPASTEFQRWNAAGTVKSQDLTGDPSPAYADIALGGQEFTIQDNQAQLAGQAAVTIPGEPGHAMTEVAAAALSDGTTAAVAWVDSGTDYVSIYDSATNSFGARIGLDWGGATDLHLVALPDGGFAVSWENGGAYKGELFDGAGNGGGILGLAGQFAAIDSHGDLYTVGQDSGGNEVVQSYAISGGGSPGGDGGTTGQTFTSDDNGDVWVGTAGNDTFNLGRGGDWVTGNGGNDSYRVAAIPWAGGHITDFNAGDVLDLTGLMSTTSDTGSDGFADGYLRVTSDAKGNAQVWADYHIAGNDGWWLVETLDGVAAASLQTHGDVVTVGSPAGGGGTSGPTAVSTADATYKAPPSVDSITLTGSQQTVTANDAHDTTIWSNNTGNVINGGSGDDTIHIGRGGDWVTGGAGTDTFVFDDIPWAPATITDLLPDQGDAIDVSGILARAGYTGSDPIADGYLKISGQQIFADYNQPGNDGWWLVANVRTPGRLHYADGKISDQYTQFSDTFTTTGSNGVLAANDGGDTLTDLGSDNSLYGRRGNDTLVLGTSTVIAEDGWGGVDTYVMNPLSTVTTHNQLGMNIGDRLDVRQLLSAAHFTGSDPVGDGYVYMALPPPPAQGELGDFVASQLMYDPDGAAGPAAARPIFDTYYIRVEQFHYADGFFVVQ
jgi:hypothetical protein